MAVGGQLMAVGGQPTAVGREQAFWGRSLTKQNEKRNRVLGTVLVLWGWSSRLQHLPLWDGSWFGPRSYFGAVLSLGRALMGRGGGLHNSTTCTCAVQLKTKRGKEGRAIRPTGRPLTSVLTDTSPVPSPPSPAMRAVGMPGGQKAGGGDSHIHWAESAGVPFGSPSPLPASQKITTGPKMKNHPKK